MSLTWENLILPAKELGAERTGRDLEKVVQMDDGSEFHPEFEQIRFERDIRLFVLTLCSPKLAYYMKWVRRIQRIEFNERMMGELQSLNQTLREWECT
jgi:hypothetical protein